MATLFCSYSHKDEAWRNRLQVHLTALQRQRKISSWHDRQILAGTEFADVIDQNLERADVILLLVSADFIASDYCWEREMKKALQRHADGEARVIPIILDFCDWKDLPFGKLLVTPKDGTPIKAWPNPDEAFLDVVNSIKVVLGTIGTSSFLESPIHSASDRRLASSNAENRIITKFATPQIVRWGTLPQERRTPVWQALFRRRGLSIGVDLGTNCTRIYHKDYGVIINEPSIVAVKRPSNEIEAVGSDALELLSRSNAHTLLEPVQESVVSDPDFAATMLRAFLTKIHVDGVSRAIFAVPPAYSKANLEILQNVAKSSHIRKVTFVESSLAAAIGCKLQIKEMSGNMIVDLGAGTTRIAVISGSEVVRSHSTRMAGDLMGEAITMYLKRKYNLLIDKRTAERIKMEIGSAYLLEKRLEVSVSGHNLISNDSKTIAVEDNEVRCALEDSIQSIIHNIREVLEHTPVRLHEGIRNRGIILTGGGALMKNLHRCIYEQTGFPASVAHDPFRNVAIGLGTLLGGAA